MGKEAAANQRKKDAHVCMDDLGNVRSQRVRIFHTLGGVQLGLCGVLVFAQGQRVVVNWPRVKEVYSLVNQVQPLCVI
jgi:hypothetical protein